MDWTTVQKTIGGRKLELQKIKTFKEFELFESLPLDIEIPEDCIRISYSQVRSYLTCRRKWGLERSKYKSGYKDYFAVGSFVHAGIDGWYANNEMQDVMNVLSATLKDKLAEYPLNREQVLTAFSQAKGYLNNYIQFAKENDDFHVVTTEAEYMVKIADNVVVKIIVDGIVKKDGELFIMEHKTPGNVVTEHLEVDDQITLYCAIVERILGVEISGIVYNLIRKKVPKTPVVLKNGKDISAAAIDTTPEIYRGALISMYGSMEAVPEKQLNRYNQLKESGNDYVVRLFLTRTAAEKAETLRKFAIIGQEMIESSKLGYTRQIPRATTDCKMCDFLNMCKEINLGEPLIAPDEYNAMLYGVQTLKIVGQEQEND